jgi:hypothetical protein
LLLNKTSVGGGLWFSPARLDTLNSRLQTFATPGDFVLRIDTACKLETGAKFPLVEQV